MEYAEVIIKRVVNEQKKLISNLEDQVEVKVTRIQEPEMKVKLLSRYNPLSYMEKNSE